MRQDWHPEELERYWTLSAEERDLLGNKTGSTRLGFALLLKSFQFDGRFPDFREDVSVGIVKHLSNQTGTPAETFWEEEWNERTQRHQRAQIREHFGFQLFRAEDEPGFLAWLMEHVVSPNPDAEAFKIAAYGYLRNRHIEPPPTERLRRLLRQAVAAREERMIAEVVAQLSQATRHALDNLVATHLPMEAADTVQISLFPVRSELSGVKDDAGSVKVETVLEEVAKLRQLRALELPDTLFRTAPPKLITHYRQRAASEPPRELRRHPPEIRYTLLAALCWQREREITDNLVELLIRIAHRVGVRAAEKVDEELLRFAKKVVGKARLLYKLAKAAKEKPDGTVKDVIYPAVGEETLEELIQEVETVDRHERQVKVVTRASYSHHYRRIVPALLEVLAFQSNNDRHRPVIEALALLYKYRDRKTAVFPLSEKVPLDGVVADDWRELVKDDRQAGAINRISYEWCVLTALREKVRCKEIWAKGAHRYRNPDEDLPQDFDLRRDEYYSALDQPRETEAFVGKIRARMEAALAAVNADLPTNAQVKVVTGKTGKTRISLTPLDSQPEPSNIAALTAALVERWPMTNLLDILKETELRVHFTDTLRTVGARETLDGNVLRRRLLLCLYGLVNELFIKLVRQRKIEFHDRQHFYRFAAGVMRRILIDHAREQGRRKRDGGTAVPLRDDLMSANARQGELMDLDRVLVELEAVDPRKCRMIELRYFLGFTADETVDLMKLSKASVDRDLRFARAWLHDRLQNERS